MEGGDESDDRPGKQQQIDAGARAKMTRVVQESNVRVEGRNVTKDQLRPG